MPIILTREAVIRGGEHQSCDRYLVNEFNCSEKIKEQR